MSTSQVSHRLLAPAAMLIAVLIAGLIAGLTAGCSGGGGGGAEIIVDRFEQLRVVATAPTTAEVWLDEPVLVTCNLPIDPDSLSSDTLRVESLAADGQPTGSLVAGSFRLANNGTLVTFEPRLPRDETEAHGGLRPGVSYATDPAASSSWQPAPSASGTRWRRWRSSAQLPACRDAP